MDDRNNSGNAVRPASDGRVPVQPGARRTGSQAGVRDNGGDARVRRQQGTRAAPEGPGAQGRGPSDKPDVFLHVSDLHVGEIYLDVEDLDAHLSLQAKLANLVQLVAGVHVHIGKVELDIKDVGAQALLKVRLENLYEILARALTTVERNPEILQGLLDTADSAVGNIGETAKQAVQPGGAASELAADVGEAGKEALGPGGAATEAVGTVGSTAQEAVRPGGPVSQAAQGLTDTASSAVQPGGAASEATSAAGNVAKEVSDSASDVAKPAYRQPRTPKRGTAGSKAREPDSSAGRSDTQQARRKVRRPGPEDAGS
jgi:hypothetical protein